MPMTDRDPIRKLIQIVARLRSADGCPWDREQTLDSLRPYLVEECHEFLDALAGGETSTIVDELGDLLLQPVFFAQLLAEENRGNIDCAAEAICNKLIRRHPHVFADLAPGDRATLDRQWDRIKRNERGSGSDESLFATLPAGMPALLLAQKITTRAARVGFDWDNVGGVMEKLHEEQLELTEAAATGDASRVAAELGDLLFTAVNLARHLGVDAETALLDANKRFVRRFQLVEKRLAAESLAPAEATKEYLNELWDMVKASER